MAFLHNDGATADSAANTEARLIPKLDAKEVSDIFTTPLHGFLRDHEEGNTQKENEAEWYKGSWGTWNKTRWRMHNFYIPKTDSKGTSLDETYRVFGMTARILVDVAKLAFAEEPDFDHNSQMGEEDMIRKLLDSGRLTAVRKPGSQLSRAELAAGAKI